MDFDEGREYYEDDLNEWETEQVFRDTLAERDDCLADAMEVEPEDLPEVPDLGWMWDELQGCNE
jgi:hypothetical protein